MHKTDQHVNYISPKNHPYPKREALHIFPEELIAENPE
jgi:hypothetical protein